MKTTLIAALFLGVVMGVGTTYGVMSRQTDSSTKMTSPASSASMEMMDHGGAMNDMSMTAMNAELKGLSGDDFDKAFLTMMIAHHQGAIDMAKQAQQSAKHDEIKTMANDIISAQNREIEQMKAWQKQWSY